MLPGVQLSNLIKEVVSVALSLSICNLEGKIPKLGFFFLKFCTLPWSLGPDKWSLAFAPFDWGEIESTLDCSSIGFWSMMLDPLVILFSFKSIVSIWIQLEARSSLWTHATPSKFICSRSVTNTPALEASSCSKVIQILIFSIVILLTCFEKSSCWYDNYHRFYLWNYMKCCFHYDLNDIHFLLSIL